MTGGTQPSARKTILLYGLIGGVLIAVLKLIEYRFLVLEHSLEIYGGIVALIFATVGIWLGLKLTRTRTEIVVREVPVHVGGPFKRNDARVEELGITPRELEILEAMAAGLSNREIGERLFMSGRTVESHRGKLQRKLGLDTRADLVRYVLDRGLLSPE